MTAKHSLAPAAWTPATLSVAALAAMSMLLFPAPASAGADTDEPLGVLFPSADGLQVSADLYIAHKSKKTPFIVLFHQAGWSRGEYREIAPRLNELGFNCMAVDLRSGGQVAGVKNGTHARAKKAGKDTAYVDALDDMRAALRFVRKERADGLVIAWGSSYSAALALRLAGTDPDLADITLAFAPGEYFAKQGKSKTWIRDAAKKIDKPVFITSAKREYKAWKAIYAAIKSMNKVSYRPKSKGNHGSRALWKKFADNDGYWRAVTAFLDQYAPR